MVRKITANVSEEELKKDLEKYRQRAIELGATEQEIMEVGQAAVVPAGAPAFLTVMSGLSQLHEELQSTEGASQ